MHKWRGIGLRQDDGRAVFTPSSQHAPPWNLPGNRNGRVYHAAVRFSV